MIKKVLIFTLILLIPLFIACGSEEENDQETIPPADVGNNYQNPSEVDVDNPSVGDVVSDPIDVCSVVITFNFTRNRINYYNYNDEPVTLEIINADTDGTVLDDWYLGSHEDGSRIAENFGEGSILLIRVYFWSIDEWKYERDCSPRSATLR